MIFSSQSLSRFQTHRRGWWVGGGWVRCSRVGRQSCWWCPRHPARPSWGSPGNLESLKPSGDMTVGWGGLEPLVQAGGRSGHKAGLHREPSGPGRFQVFCQPASLISAPPGFQTSSSSQTRSKGPSCRCRQVRPMHLWVGQADKESPEQHIWAYIRNAQLALPGKSHG